MPLSWNEIRDRAIAFTREWKDEQREHAEAKSFWDAFFHVFGMSRRRLAGFFLWAWHLAIATKSLYKTISQIRCFGRQC
jgi:hypothetical protein